MAPDEIEASRVRCFRLTIYVRKWCQSTPIYWYQLHCCLGFLFIATQLLLRYTQIQVYRALLSAHSSLVLIFVIDVSKTEMVTLVLHWDKKKYISLNWLFVFSIIMISNLKISYYLYLNYLFIRNKFWQVSFPNISNPILQTVHAFNCYKYSVQIYHFLSKI